MVERLGLSDLELWRDIRELKIDSVSHPNTSGLRLVRRIFCRRLSRYRPPYHFFLWEASTYVTILTTQLQLAEI